MDHDLVMGRFRLRERIGSGGMGTVYRAFDERLQREVAVKEIPGADSERVLREAQAAARLNHPGIATVYELGRHASSALLVTELIPGATLAELRGRGALSDHDAAEIGIQLCEALAHAHGAGVVHRDVKPQNVIVSEGRSGEPRAKLMDFGIARLAGAPTLTATGEIVGTLAYMAPEQSDGLEAGPEADVYSLALTLYECWTGRNPVASATPAATARRIGMPIPSLARHRPDLDRELIAAIDACLEADPGRRPQPRALRGALRGALPTLDPERPVPRGEEPEPGLRAVPRLGLARIAAVLALAGALAVVWGPLGASGVALVAGVLLAPAIAFLPAAGPFIPPLASLLALAGVVGAYPAAAAHAGRRAGERAIAGALGWCWALVLAIGLGLGPTLEIAPRAAPGWESSAALAASDLLLPLLAPSALAGLGAFAAAAALLGWILSARHTAVIALGALIWAAALTAALDLVVAGQLGGRPVVIAIAAGAAVAYEYRRRARGRAWIATVRERSLAATATGERIPAEGAGVGA